MVNCVLSKTGTGIGMLLFLCCRGWLDKLLVIIPVAIGFLVFLCYNLKFSGLLNKKKFFSSMLQLYNIYASYILLRLYVGMSALALFSSLVVRILSTHLEGA